jgi:hypothetical protein
MIDRLKPFTLTAWTGVPQHLADSAWLQHTPFAKWVVMTQRPRRLVELGTHTGVSFLSFCEGQQAAGYSGADFVAVDTWRGDEHSGYYGEDVFDHFSAVLYTEYLHSARMIRSSFDDARPLFADNSIQLLHIDGHHSYESVRHDYNTWKSALAPDAIVLFHDIAVRERGFGVWKLWAELTCERPYFEFHHGYGLGLLGPGSIVPKPLRYLLELSRTEQNIIRLLFESMGMAVEKEFLIQTLKQRNM